MTDEFELGRFVAAQDRDRTYEAALSELRAGHKTSHWMWFVFPQIAGLGQSPISKTYAICSLAEARAYLEHPVLGARLIQCSEALLGLSDRSAEQILGSIDAIKLRSSMTLFARAAPQNSIFGQVLEAYFGGDNDEATDALLR